MLTRQCVIISDPTAYDDSYAFSRDAQLLEARGKKAPNKHIKKQAPPPAPLVTFRKGEGPHLPDNHLKRLNLVGKKRKAVEKWHIDKVAEHMKTVKNAHSAEIM